MVGGIAGVFSSLTSTAFERGTRDDDAVDRLNHVVMNGLLIFLAVFTGTKQFAGSPIYCWLPANYDEKFHRRFANNYCWVNTMYNIPFEEEIPVEEEKRYFNDVSYYRWASVIFIVLACLFRAPQLLWKELKYFSGANIEKLVGMTTETTLMDQDKREKQLTHVAEFIHRWVTTRKLQDRQRRFGFLHRSVRNYIICYGKRSGHNLVVIYLLIKLLYLLNSVGQFFIVSAFLKTNYLAFGFNAMKSYAENGQWEDESVFPRVALCDMKVLTLANIHTYTIQCVLGINIFLEKFFLIVWVCLIFILIANAASLFRWAFQLLHEDNKVRFFTKYSMFLFQKTSATYEEENLLQDMAKSYLQSDGVFLIRMIAENSTDILTADLVRQIWLKYRTFHASKSKKNKEKFEKTSKDDAKMNGGATIQLDDVDN